MTPPLLLRRSLEKQHLQSAHRGLFDQFDQLKQLQEIAIPLHGRRLPADITALCEKSLKNVPQRRCTMAQRPYPLREDQLPNECGRHAWCHCIAADVAETTDHTMNSLLMAYIYTCHGSRSRPARSLTSRYSVSYCQIHHARLIIDHAQRA